MVEQAHADSDLASEACAMRPTPTETPMFEAGRHYCAIFQTEEEWAECLLAYFRQCLARHERFLYLYHKHSPEEVMSCLSGVEGATEAFGCGQAVLVRAAEIFCPAGVFDFDAQLSSAPALIKQALDDGYSGLCATCEASLVTEEIPGAEHFLDYEARLEASLVDSPCTCLCQYDRRYMPAETITEALRVHRYAVINRRVVTNRYYVSPDRYLNPNRDDAILDARLEALLEWDDIELALRASEERYRLVADYTHDWEYWSSPRFGLQYVSPSAERITGYTAEEFLGDPSLLRRIIHPDDLEAVLEHVKPHTKDGETVHIDTRIIRRDGEVRWISHLCQRVYSATGEYIGRRGSNRDITERKLAEHKLGETNSLLQAVLAQAPVAIVLLDLQGVVQLWSDGAEVIFGWEAAEVIGRPNPLVPPHLAPMYGEIVAAIQQGHVHISREVPCLAKGGHLVDTSMSVTAIRNSQGDLIALLGILTDIAERKQAEAERERLLAEVDAERLHFRTVFEQAGVGMAIAGMDAHFTQVNRAFADMLGYTPEELVKMGVEQTTPSEDLGADRCPGLALLAGESEGYELEKRYLRKDGSVVWGRLMARLIRDPQGRPMQVVSMIEDITARKAAEAESARLLAAVEAERLQFRTVFEQAGVGMVVMHMGGRVAAVNQAFADMLGYAPDEMVNFTTADFSFPEDIATLCRLGKDMVSGELDQCNLEKRYLRKDGSVVWGRLTSRLTRDAEGQARQTISMVEDITARKAAEADRERLLVAVEAERLQFRTVFEQAGVGMSIMGLDGRLTAANQALADMLGYAPSEMVGFTIADFTPPEDAVDARRLGAVMLSGEHDHFDLEKCYLRKDGSRVWGHLMARLIRDTQGQPWQMVAMVTDITARKEAAAAHERLTAELEAIFVSLTDAVAVYDDKWNLIRANDRARWYCGADMDELNLEEVAARLEIRNQDGTPFPFSEWPGREVLLGGQISNLPLRIRTIRGEERHISASAAPIWLNGEIAVMVLSWHDVTALHEALDAARKQADKLDAVIASVGDGLAIYDTEGRMLRVNQACQRILQYDRDLFQLTHADRREQVAVKKLDGTVYPPDQLPLARALGGETVIGEVGEITRADGSSVWVSSSAAPLWDGPLLVGAVNSLTDITRLREAQDELRQHRDHLEELVQERTAELTRQQDRLRALTSQLSLAEERERRRLATLIHDDLAQTLAFAKMHVGSLRSQTDLSRLRQGHERLEGLLDEAMASSRWITMQLSPPVLYRMGLGPAVEWLGGQMASAHGYEVEVDLCDELLPLSENTRVTLFQAVRELFTNAAKYAQASRVTVTVGRMNGQVEIRVSDDGAGFDPTQVQVTDTGGFGLFNIGERLAGIAGGFDIESAPGAGARFTLRAPLDGTP